MLDRLFFACVLVALGIAAYVISQRLLMRHASYATVGRGQPSILYFSTPLCAPCVTQWRFLQQLCSQIGRAVDIEMVDAEDYPEIARNYGVFTVPTTLVIDPAGVVRHANYGLAQARKLSAQLKDVETAGA